MTRIGAFNKFVDVDRFLDAFGVGFGSKQPEAREIYPTSYIFPSFRIQKH